MNKTIFLIISISLFSQTISFAESKQKAYEYFTIASYEMNKDNYEMALEYYKKFLELEPENFQARKDILEISVSMKNPKIAHDYADNLIKEAPEDYKVLGLYGGYQWLLGNTEKAKEAYSKSISLDAENPVILHQYIMLLATENSPEITTYLEKHAELYPHGASYLYNQVGKMQITKQNFDEALSLFQKAKTFDKYNPNSYLNSMTAYLLNNQNEKFLQEALILEGTGYKNAAFFGEIGAFYLKENNKEKALKYFDKALAQDKSNVEVNEFLSLYYRKEGDFDKAIHYITSRADFQTNPKLWLGISYISFEAQKPQQAREYLKTAYKKFPEDLEVAYFYATDLYEINPYESYKVLKEILKKDPTYTSAKQQFIYSAEKAKKYSDMEKTVNEMLQHNPDNHQLLNFLAYSYANRGIKLKKAEELSLQAVSQDPNYAYLDTLGWIYYKQGELEKAKPKLLESVKLIEPTQTESYEVFQHLGIICFDMKEFTESYKYFEKAYDLSKQTDEVSKKYLSRLDRKLGFNKDK